LCTSQMMQQAVSATFFLRGGSCPWCGLPLYLLPPSLCLHIGTLTPATPMAIMRPKSHSVKEINYVPLWCIYNVISLKFLGEGPSDPVGDCNDYTVSRMSRQYTITTPSVCLPLHQPAVRVGLLFVEKVDPHSEFEPNGITVTLLLN
jgi:hypothetical protein